MKSYHKQNPESNLIITDPKKLKEIAEEGLMKLSLELGMEALQQILAQDVEGLVGPKGKHNQERKAYRHGSEATKVVLGGQKISVQKPRVRSMDGQELQLKSLETFQKEDPLEYSILEHVLSGVSYRKYSRTLNESIPEKTSVSKSTVSRRFTKAMEHQMSEFFSRPINEDYPVLMLDGIALSKITVVAVMGITNDGHKKMLGIIEGGSENSLIVKDLLGNLIERGLDPERNRLVVIDGAKALRKAVLDTFGDRVIIQRCQVHKKRNVLSHLPKSEQTNIGFAISRAYLEFDEQAAKKVLEQIANNLEPRYPKAAESLREGMDETLSIHRLKIPGTLRQTLSNTNAIESANSVSMWTAGRVSGFRNGTQALRWMAAGFMEAEKSFRRVRGYKQIPVLTVHLDSLSTQKLSLPLSHLA
jgi:transposase-like protein